MWRPNLKTLNQCDLRQQIKIRSWVEVFAGRGYTWSRTWKIISRWWYWLTADGEAFWELRALHEAEFVAGVPQPKRKPASRPRAHHRRPKRRSARQRRRVAPPARVSASRRQAAQSGVRPTVSVCGVDRAIATDPPITPETTQNPNALNP